MSDDDTPRRRAGENEERGGNNNNNPYIEVSARGWLERIESEVRGINARLDRDFASMGTRMSAVERDMAVHIGRIGHDGELREMADLALRMRVVEQELPSAHQWEEIGTRQSRIDDRLRTVETLASGMERVDQFGRWIGGTVIIALLSIGIALANLLIHAGGHP